MDDMSLVTALPLVGVVLGALLSPAANSWQSRRAETRRRFDAARSALNRAQALRHYPSAVPEGVIDPQGFTPDRVVSFNADIREEGVRAFTLAMSDARQALADVRHHDRRIGDAIDQSWELPESALAPMMAVLRDGERRALAWRASKRLDVA